MGQEYQMDWWEKSDCLICDIVVDEPWVPFRQMFKDEEYSSEKLLETSSFFVIADIAPIVEGYCLIVAKKHLPSMAFLEPSEINELVAIKHVLSEVMSEIYGAYIMFEHGASSFKHNAGACIDHAHLHVVPTQIDLTPFLSDLILQPLGQYHDIIRLKDNTGYLYYENQKGEIVISTLANCAQQYFRRKLCHALRFEGPWNWRDFIRHSQTLETKSLIKNGLTKLVAPLTHSWLLYQRNNQAAES